MHEEIVFAGFGGQGVLFAAHVLAQAAMFEGKHVAWIPSYGPEMRGGTAAATVIISDEEIGSLVVAEPTAAVVMNTPSLVKYAPALKPGGHLFINRTLIEQSTDREDIMSVDVRANEVASELGNDRLANMVLLGAVIAATGAVALEAAVEALRQSLDKGKTHLLADNEAALRRGFGGVSGEA
jgi:2-oxoglutarate ferredoxin oxidoreductase subunit gamma